MTAAPDRTRVAAFLLRTAAYLVFWVVLAGTDVKDLAVGVVTAILAALSSLALLPPGELTIRPTKALALFIRFLWQSVAAGVSVARIALSPQMPLSPGVIDYRTNLPPGNRRFTFMTFASLLPGTLPVRTDGSEKIPVHVLDTRQPAGVQLADEEARLAAMFSGERSA
jgi:multicomponent Na+:H+ antiporter subunit E